MRAMILAAGRGERMGALTANTPKPLLRVNGRCLIEYVILNLKKNDITEVVINVAYLGNQILELLGSGHQYGVNITYSIEEQRLETGGGIYKALHALGDEPFLVLSSDVMCDFPLKSLPAQLTGLAHLVLVPNPVFHPKGDFGLQNGLVDMDAKPTYNLGGIGVYHPALFADCTEGYFPLNQLLFPAIRKGKVTGQLHHGSWFNIGTQEQLAEFAKSDLCLAV